MVGHIHHNLIQLLFAGGITFFSDASSVRSAVVDIYDTLSETLLSTNLPGGARSNLAAAASNHFIFFSGGLEPSGTASAAVDIFDAETLLWSQSQLSTARAYLTAAALPQVRRVI